MEEITMKKLRAGIVGCGGIANAKHLPAMEKCGLYEVVAFCDIIPEQAQETKESSAAVTQRYSLTTGNW